MNIFDSINAQMTLAPNVFDIREDQMNVLLLNAVVNGSVDDMTLDEASRAAEFMLSLTPEQYADQFLPFEHNSAGLEAGFFKSVGSGIMRVINAIIDGIKKLFKRLGEFLGFKTKNIESKASAVDKKEKELDAILGEVKDELDKMDPTPGETFAEGARKAFEKFNRDASEKFGKTVDVDIDPNGGKPETVVEVEVPKDAKPDSAQVVDEKENSVVVEVKTDKAEEIVAEASKNKMITMYSRTHQLLTDTKLRGDYKLDLEDLTLDSSEMAKAFNDIVKSTTDSKEQQSKARDFFGEILMKDKLSPIYGDARPLLRDKSKNIIAIFSALNNAKRESIDQGKASVTIAVSALSKYAYDVKLLDELKGLSNETNTIATDLDKPDLSYLDKVDAESVKFAKFWGACLTRLYQLYALYISDYQVIVTESVNVLDELITFELKILNSVKVVVTNKKPQARGKKRK